MKLFVCLPKQEVNDNPNNNSSTSQLRLSLHSAQLMVPVDEEVLLYGWVDAVADVGGYMGLLLGASCLSLVEVKTFLWVLNTVAINSYQSAHKSTFCFYRPFWTR